MLRALDGGGNDSCLNIARAHFELFVAVVRVVVDDARVDLIVKVPRHLVLLVLRASNHTIFCGGNVLTERLRLSAKLYLLLHRKRLVEGGPF